MTSPSNDIVLNQITPEILSELSRESRVQIVKIHCAMNNSEIEAVINAISKNPSVLAIAFHGPAIRLELLQKFLPKLESLKKIDQLVLADLRLQPGELLSLLKILESNPNLFLLLFNQISFDSADLEQLAALSETMTSLEAISLVNNQLGDAGLKTLLSKMQKTRVKSLTVRHNLISDLGIEDLVAFLEKNQTISFLDFVENNISDLGAELVAALLRRNNLIRKISFQNNLMTDYGTATLNHVWNHQKHTMDAFDMQLKCFNLSGMKERATTCLGSKIPSLIASIHTTPTPELIFKLKAAIPHKKMYANIGLDKNGRLAMIVWSLDHKFSQNFLNALQDSIPTFKASMPTVDTYPVSAESISELFG